MSGLVNIIEQILNEANQQSDAAIAAAKAQAQEIRVRGDEEVKKMCEKAAEKNKADIANYRKRMESAKDLKRRTRVLESRQNVISEMIEKAYDRVCNADTEDYFAFMEKVITANLMSEKGEIYFSKKDLDRMPDGFVLKIAEAAAKMDGELTIGLEPKDIENGCVLVYGGIEENCTVRALFDAKKDQMTDLIYRMLYV